MLIKSILSESKICFEIGVGKVEQSSTRSSSVMKVEILICTPVDRQHVTISWTLVLLIQQTQLIMHHYRIYSVDRKDGRFLFLKVMK